MKQPMPDTGNGYVSRAGWDSYDWYDPGWGFQFDAYAPEEDLGFDTYGDNKHWFGIPAGLRAGETMHVGFTTEPREIVEYPALPLVDGYPDYETGQGGADISPAIPYAIDFGPAEPGVYPSAMTGAIALPGDYLAECEDSPGQGRTARPRASRRRTTICVLSVSQVAKYDWQIVEPLFLSVGDDTPDGRLITTTVEPSDTNINVTHRIQRTSNPNGKCDATLDVPNQQGTHYVNARVDAAGSNCSGVFNVHAVANGTPSDSPSTVVVPPQKLIQMIHGEAGGQTAWDDASQPSVGAVARNRLDDSDFGNYNNYHDLMQTGQFYGSNDTTPNGPIPVVKHAGNVFRQAAETIDIVENATCFWSPTYEQWLRVLTALNTPTTAFPPNVGAPSCYSPPERQVIYKSSVAASTRPELHFQGAPAFLFIQQRSPDEPSAKVID